MNERKQERIRQLALLLGERRALHIREAADLLGVSEMTVRRDVSTRRDLFSYFGGHIVLAIDADDDAPYELSRAADNQTQAKRLACSHAARHVRPDDTIFIDCGTTLVHLIDHIPEDCRITAVCYALNVAERLVRRDNVALVMLGGFYHPASASFSDPSSLELLKTLGINVAFLSAAGLDLHRGATCAHFHEAEIKRRVMSLCRRNYLVADSSKIGKLKPAFFGSLDAFQAVITEDGEVSTDELADKFQGTAA